MAEPNMDLWGKIVAFIREFGLPSFIVVWFLFRFEKKLEKFTKTLRKLITMNVVMLKTLDKDEEADELLDVEDDDESSKVEASVGKYKVKIKVKTGEDDGDAHD